MSGSLTLTSPKLTQDSYTKAEAKELIEQMVLDSAMPIAFQMMSIMKSVTKEFHAFNVKENQKCPENCVECDMRKKLNKMEEHVDSQ